MFFLHNLKSSFSFFFFSNHLEGKSLRAGFGFLTWIGGDMRHGMKQVRQMIAPESFRIPIPRAADLMPAILRHLLERMTKQVPDIAIDACQKSGREAGWKQHARTIASGAGADKDRICEQSKTFPSHARASTFAHYGHIRKLYQSQVWRLVVADFWRELARGGLIGGVHGGFS